MNLEYTIFRGDINIELMSRVIKEIMNSKEIEIAHELEEGQLSHVVIKGTKIPIAYIGDDNLELVNFKDERLEKYHKLFTEMYNKAFLACHSTLN
jgi:hypothetical protein